MLQASICNNLTHVNQPIFFLLFAIDVVNVSFGFVFTQVFLDAALQLAPDDAGDVEQSREYEEVEGDPLVVGVVQGGPVRDVKFDVRFPCGGQVWPLTHFFMFPFCKKSLICLEGKSMTPHRENTIL